MGDFFFGGGGGAKHPNLYLFYTVSNSDHQTARTGTVRASSKSRTEVVVNTPQR